MATTDTSTQAGRELVLAVVGAHSASLLAVARRHSLCADDAQDAYQRALEIFLRRADTVDPPTAAAWLRTVVKHEAMAVRASRRRIVGPAEVDMDRAEARDVLPADERAAASERDERSAEALSRLKPHEVRALVLKARGYSYREIADITGWTYTKVNRCLTEGRRAFLDRFAEIETGRECDRWAATLSALADGEAQAGDLAAARPHLRHCAACRARLREFRAAPRAVAALAPAPLLAAAAGGPAGDGPGLVARLHDAPANDGPSVFGRIHDALVAGWSERVVLSAHRAHAALETASAAKLAAVAASATALAGGGAAALTEVADPPAARPAAAVAPAEPVKAAPHVPAPGPAPAVPLRATPRASSPAAVRRKARPTTAPVAAEFGPGGDAAGPAVAAKRSRSAAGPRRSDRARSRRTGSAGTESPPAASPAAPAPQPSASPVPSPSASPSSSSSSSEFAP
ncbi:MAG: hypothetical protein QOE65_496 [Solirubrobacteraceae bacterium]|jgi:RNA polymerase sigma factor (sigma-70 family)|nr:hypothetical protein [Solirubrobacteraceae bacterium]